MTDKRSLTSAENGKKGGRPVATATLIRQKSRELIAKRLEENLEPIIAKAIEQASNGDQQARLWLSDQAWGKAPQAVVTRDDDGNDKPIPIMNVVPTDDSNK